MLLTILAWNNKNKEFFFREEELKNYVESQEIAIEKYRLDEKYQLEKKYLEERNIVITDNKEQNGYNIANAIFQVVEKNVLKKLNISPPTNVLIKCANNRRVYYAVPTFHELINIILKQKLLTENLEPTDHYVLFIIRYFQLKPKFLDPDLRNKLHLVQNFQIPTKYDSSLLYYIYSIVLGNFVKIQNQQQYNHSFIINEEVLYLSDFSEKKVVMIKNHCLNNEKSVLEIDKIIFILEYIDNEINVYLESFQVSDVVKKYLFAIAKSRYYHMCRLLLINYLTDPKSKNNYKSLSDITYKS